MSSVLVDVEDLGRVLEIFEGWMHDFDTGHDRYYSYCSECGWDSRTDATETVMGHAVLSHKPDCKLKAALERLQKTVYDVGSSPKDPPK